MTSAASFRLAPLAVLALASALVCCACSSKRCGPETCDGCCSATGECVGQTSAQACGAQGSLCQECEATEACVTGACRPINGGDDDNCAAAGLCTDPAGGCGAPCGNGCCDSQGKCHPTGLDPQACGNRARQCESCTDSEACIPVRDGGICVVEKSDVFKPCSTNADCNTLPNGICKKTTTSGATPYKDGYCTHLCGRAGLPICPGDSECVGGVNAFGEDDAFCWKQCETDVDCRGGTDYACYWSGPQNLGCWLKPRPAPAGIPGAACTQDSQCGPPPDFNPFCYQATLPDGGASGFTGGSCMVECDITGDEQCGPSGLCVPFTSNAGQVLLCQQACTNINQGAGDPADGGCRQGYVCRGFLQADGGYEPRGFCSRDCNAPFGGNDTVGCPGGYLCAQSGYCCRSDGGCI